MTAARDGGSQPKPLRGRTWTAGYLWSLDAPLRYRALADLELPLLTSAAEADAFRTMVLRSIDDLETRASAGLPRANVAAREAWTKGLLSRDRWALREALLWVATRDLEKMADMVLTSLWPDDDPHIGPPGLTWVSGHIQALAGEWEFVERTPALALLHALRGARVGASGLFEGRDQRQGIDAIQWEDLEFGMSPGTSRSGSTAHRIGQTQGIAWSGHWTDLLFDCHKLFAAFPALDGIDAASVTPEQWAADYAARPKWTIGEVVAWVGLRDEAEVCRVFGPAGYWFGMLNIPTDRRLDLLLSAIENEGGAHDRFPRHAIERAIQRQGLLAAGVAPGGHVTHTLENLIGLAFWRDDVTAHFAKPLQDCRTEAPLPIAAQEPIKRASDAAVERNFKEWVRVQLDQNCLPDHTETYRFALRHGRTRAWTRERLKTLPPALRLSNGMRRRRPEISDEQRAAYLAHFGPS